MSWCTIEFDHAIPINKQLYSFSYVCFTAGAAGIVFSAFYVLATSTINRNGFESLLKVYKETDAVQKKTRILRFMVLCLYRAKHKRSGSAQGPNTMIIHPRHSGSDQDIVKITVTGSSVTGGATS